MHRYKILIGAAILAGVSVLLQVYKVALPMGVMDIDAVGVPWLISTFLFGPLGGILTSVVSAIGIGAFATTGWVGAVMKFIATIIMVLLVALFGKVLGYGKKSMLFAFVACLIARPVVMVFFNYYIGIPLFFGIPADVAMREYPVEVFLVPNAILAALDFWVAYLIVFRTKLKMRLNVES